MTGNIAIQALKTIEPSSASDEETEKFLRGAYKEALTQRKEGGIGPLALKSYSAPSVSAYLQKSRKLKVDPEEIKDFYHRIDEITKGSLTPKQRAETVVDMVDITEVIGKEVGKVLGELFEEAFGRKLF